MLKQFRSGKKFTGLFDSICPGTGHAAFTNMRERGAKLADIAILVVAADDGVKTQTKEVINAIKSAGTPFIVAINKIDKNNADVNMTKQSLAEADVFVEGYGGDVSAVLISAKVGTGVKELLDLILLSAEMEDLKGDPNIDAEGVVVEANKDTRIGNTATLIITNGTMRKGMCLTIGSNVSPIRSITNSDGEQIDEASFSSPVSIAGLCALPNAGEIFKAFDNKKEAEVCANKCKINNISLKVSVEDGRELKIPIVIKADTSGTLEEIKAGIRKLENERVAFKYVSTGVGAVSENDIKQLLGFPESFVIAFGVGADKHAVDIAERMGITIETFDIIYDLTKWLERIVLDRTPKHEEHVVIGTLKVLKIFGRQKNKQVIGCRVNTGTVEVGRSFKIARRENELGVGKIMGLQNAKMEVKEVGEGEQFGARVDSRIEIAEGDVLEVYKIEKI